MSFDKIDKNGLGTAGVCDPRLPRQYRCIVIGQGTTTVHTS